MKPIALGTKKARHAAAENFHEALEDQYFHLLNLHKEAKQTGAHPRFIERIGDIVFVTRTRLDDLETDGVTRVVVMTDIYRERERSKAEARLRSIRPLALAA